MSWTKEQVMELLEHYEAYPCLYKIRSPQYKNKHSRNCALEEIRAKLSQIRPETTVADIKAKYNTLRSTFLAERRKIAASKKSGCGSDDIHIPNLYYYKKISFLLDSGIEARKAYDSIEVPEGSSEKDQEGEVEMNENLFEDDPFPHASSSQSEKTNQPLFSPRSVCSESFDHDTSDTTVGHVPPKAKTKKAMPIDNASVAICKMAEAISNKENKKDYIDTYLNYIGEKIKKIKNPDILDEVEDQINEVVSNAYKKYLKNK